MFVDLLYRRLPTIVYSLSQVLSLPLPSFLIHLLFLRLLGGSLRFPFVPLANPLSDSRLKSEPPFVREPLCQR